MATENNKRLGHVLLISNYAPDKQFSMRRFTEQLKEGLEAEGVQVGLYLPKVIFGKLGAQPSGIGKWLGYIDKYLLAPVLIRWKLRSLQAGSVVHICDHSNAIYTKTLQGIPHLITCHDLLAVRSALGEIPQNRPKWTGRKQQSMILKGLRRSRMIASVSEATRQDVSRIVGNIEDWQHLVPNSLDDTFIKEAHQPPPTEKPTAPALTGLSTCMRYVMHIGGEKWYKNRAAALKIFSRLLTESEDLKLIVVGPEFSDAALRDCDCWMTRDRIHYARGISDEDLRALYCGAEILLFPSLIEGFGWPILEAQACGCPVLTLNIEPMRSLNAVPELAVEADTACGSGIDTLAHACRLQMRMPAQAHAEQARRLKDFAAKFTNQASAQAYLTLYKKLLIGASPQ